MNSNKILKSIKKMKIMVKMNSMKKMKINKKLVNLLRNIRFQKRNHKMLIIKGI
jgi:hypothetical protein